MTCGDSLYLVSTCSDSSGWLPSCSWVSALPMSWSRPMRLASLHVGADLGRHHPGEPRHLLRVLQAVLAVRRPVLHAPDELDQLGVEPVHAHLEAGLVALLLEVLLHLLLDLARPLPRCGPGWMRPSAIRRWSAQARDLPAVGVVGGDQDGLRRVVDDQVHPGVQLERPDVPALAPDDAALHVVRWQVDDGDRRLHRVVGGEALDGGGEHFLGLDVRRLARLFLEAHAHELRPRAGTRSRPGP